jgi:hypothetical protein
VFSGGCGSKLAGDRSWPALLRMFCRDVFCRDVFLGRIRAGCVLSMGVGAGPPCPASVENQDENVALTQATPALGWLARSASPPCPSRELSGQWQPHARSGHRPPFRIPPGDAEYRGAITFGFVAFSGGRWVSGADMVRS